MCKKVELSEVSDTATVISVQVQTHWSSAVESEVKIFQREEKHFQVQWEEARLRIHTLVPEDSAAEELELRQERVCVTVREPSEPKP